MGAKTAKTESLSRTRTVNTFTDFVNESKVPSYTLPADAQVVWDQVCRILPDLKSSTWNIDYGSGSGNLHIDPVSKLSKQPMHHLKDERGHVIEDMLGDMQIGYSEDQENEEIEKGFWIVTSAGYVLQHEALPSSDDDLFITSMNPFEIAMIFDPATTTKYMANHKIKGWQKASAKHLGLI
jgi:hypothetical protein